MCKIWINYDYAPRILSSEHELFSNFLYLIMNNVLNPYAGEEKQENARLVFYCFVVVYSILVLFCWSRCYWRSFENNFGTKRNGKYIS